MTSSNTIAVDRLNERVAELYQSTHPGVLRLIKMVVEAARQHNVRVSMCGEMAGDLDLTPLLIGLGLDELSASTGQVPYLKEAVRKLCHEDCKALAAAALAEQDAKVIQRMSRMVAQQAYGDLLD
jgi:phosphotransferase system enzyme I (PtsI)